VSDLKSRAETARAEAGLSSADHPQLVHQVTGGHAGVAPRASAPDVEDSPIAAELDVPVHIAWSRVMGEVQWIGKTGRADKYNFRGIDAVRNAVGPALRKHGVMVFPVSTTAEYSTVSRSGGGLMTYCRATVNFAVFGPRGDRLGGDSFTIETMGEAFDTGDKSSMKAQSVAERTMYVAGLAIPTDQPAMDPEHGTQYELGEPKAPSAEEYAAAILDDTVSIQRLQQIKAELTSNRALGVTEVEPPGMDKVRLIDLVQRVGAARTRGTQV
jgi:hypothetical protein